MVPLSCHIPSVFYLHVKELRVYCSKLFMLLRVKINSICVDLKEILFVQHKQNPLLDSEMNLRVTVLEISMAF